jgi:hypothetical protein
MSKRETIVQFLHADSVVRLYLDPRPADVLVPAWLKQQEWLCLDIGLSHVLPRPIPDLDLGNAGVYGTLIFGATSFYCMVPYESIHAARHMVSGAIVSWASAATAQIRTEAAAVRPLLPPPPQTGAKVIDMAGWRRAHGR